MNISSSKKPPKTEAPAEPGLLVGVRNPPPQLGQLAQSKCGLATPPQSMLLGIPATSIKKQDANNEYAKALKSVTKSVSKLLVSNAPPWLKSGVNVFWLGVGLYDLYDKWNDPDPNIPALIVETANRAFDVVSMGSSLTGIGNEWINNDDLQNNVGMVFAAGSAAANDQNIAVAITNYQLGNSEIGKALGLVTPVLNAALSSSPEYKGIKFTPMPQVI